MNTLPSKSSFDQSADLDETAPSLKTLLIILLLSIVILFVGVFLGNRIVTIVGSLIAIIMSGRIFYPSVKSSLTELISPKDGGVLLASLGLGFGLVGLLQSFGASRWISFQLADANWDAIGALGEVFGALGQILIAVLAVYVAWRQYVISKDLTIQQNTITQQQTIDTYFQGISDLVLDDEGLLEDWPQERAIAEGRTAAIFSSVDAIGKAKILRFLSRAKLLSPLKRDQRLGRPILDGMGGYAEDRNNGTRVVDLGVMLAGSSLEDSDLRWVDLSEANLIRVNLSNCELVKSNLSRSILVGANLSNSDLNGARLYYGNPETASPRSRTEAPNYRTGEHTGAVVENADFTNAEDISEEQRCYICAWGGEKTRSTVPGGCLGIPNQLGR
ncbi:MAG: pentapeptide repeat-containing protein, partial [Alkalinema sp. CAN_BIN05]|nr:pentapeptide repeat-containing protein [Alkalinema sp. CAN_BIN05]